MEFDVKDLVFSTQRAAQERADELLKTAVDAKYYDWTFEYNRYNPQIGTNRHSSTVIAKTKAEAERKAKKYCSEGVYGSNYFVGLISKKLLTLGVDYKLRAVAAEEPVYNGASPRRMIALDWKATIEIVPIYK